MENSRRKFIKNSLTGAAAVSFGGILPGFSAKSYDRIVNSNDKIKVAVMGVNSRGFAVGTNMAKQKNCEVLFGCDVDSRAAEKFVSEVEKLQNRRPRTEPDFRKALENKDLDALVVTAPDHWHAPAAILACKAGKHVYVEKPCSHNPYEGELIVAAAKKYNLQVQMGNQRRSWPNVIAAINEVHDGIIGRAYFAKTWYANNRLSIGTGKVIPPPEWLDYELWQGPAPRRPYKDNLIHYNWHWFWNWGTGEALNNGTHMVDLARWGLGVDYPVRVSSSGGRFRYTDDWETPDTQIICLEFGNKSMITWEGLSCNGVATEGNSVGVQFYGEKGSLIIGEGNAYKVFDLENNLIKEVKDDSSIDPLNLADPAKDLDALHFQNFFEGIRNGIPLNSEIENGYKSTLLVQLGNIAIRSGEILKTDPKNGHIINNNAALKYWKREYAPGWEPTL